MKNSALQHLLGLSGQVASVLPLLLITVFLSRTQGLEAAGLFTVLVGASAAAYSTSLWGLRTSVLLDRFDTVAPESYLVARLIALLLASFVSIIAGVVLNIPLALVLLLVTLRTCDGIVDYAFAATQVWRGTQTAIVQYTVQHGLKLAAILIAVAISLIIERAVFESLAILFAIGVLLFVLRRVRSAIRTESAMSERSRWREVRQVFVNAFWFAIAASVCAVLTSAPRISLSWFYDGDFLGAVGVTLSVSTFFGMAFYTTWIRHVASFSDASRFRAAALQFIMENAIIAVLAALAAWFVLPSLVGVVFGFAQSDLLITSRSVLTASVVFFAGMNMCNLYKATLRPWMEALSYLAALSIAVIAAIVYAEFRNTELVLLLAGCVMFALSAFSFVTPRKAGSEAQI